MFVKKDFWQRRADERKKKLNEYIQRKSWDKGNILHVYYVALRLTLI